MQQALVPARHPAAALLASQRPMAKLRFSHSSPATAPTASALLRKSDHGRRVAEGVHAPQFIAACPPRATENDEEAPSAWVSEACVKAVILGLLGTLADEEDSSAATVSVSLYCTSKG